jgi:hypothetical protein
MSRPKAELTCWDCGATNDEGASECWLCHRRSWLRPPALPMVPKLAPEPSPEPSPSAGLIPVALALGVVGLGSLLLAPWLSIPLLIVVLLAAVSLISRPDHPPARGEDSVDRGAPAAGNQAYGADSRSPLMALGCGLGLVSSVFAIGAIWAVATIAATLGVPLLMLLFIVIVLYQIFSGIH